MGTPKRKTSSVSSGWVVSRLEKRLPEKLVKRVKTKTGKAAGVWVRRRLDLEQWDSISDDDDVDESVNYGWETQVTTIE